MKSKQIEKLERFLLKYSSIFLATGILIFLFACSGGGSVPKKTNNSTNPTPTDIVNDSLDVSVIDGLDDAEETTSGGVNRSSKALDLGVFPVIGMRFVGINIPQGATISNAYIQFKADKANSETSNFIIQAETSDDAPVILGSNSNLSVRAKTAASVSWSPAPWTVVGEADFDQRTPNISSVIQEIVSRPGWSSNNALIILMTGSGKRIAESYNGDQAGAPLLHVDYSYEDSPPSVDSFMVSSSVAELNEQVTFSWSVSDPESQPISCTLDVNSDGNVEYSFSDCYAATNQTHSYTIGGLHVAKLTAKDIDGAIDQSTVSVTVASTTNSVNVAAAGDIACDPNSSHFNGGDGTVNHCHMKAVSDLMLSMNLDAVLALGDNSYEEGTLDQFNTSYDPSWGRLKGITYPAVGNHEYLTDGAQGYFDYFGAAAGDPTKGYYSYNLGAWHIVVLNSQCSQVGGCKSWSPQGSWLIQDLADNPAPCTLAYWHIPRFSSGRIGSKTHTEDFWTELYSAGADVVLSGHDHNYERFAPQDPDGNLDLASGIREFVIGVGGKSHLDGGTIQPNSEVIDNQTYGVLKLTLNPTSYDWEFVSDDGQGFTDSGSTQCH